MLQQSRAATRCVAKEEIEAYLADGVTALHVLDLGLFHPGGVCCTLWRKCCGRCQQEGRRACARIPLRCKGRAHKDTWGMTEPSGASCTAAGIGCIIIGCAGCTGACGICCIGTCCIIGGLGYIICGAADGIMGTNGGCCCAAGGIIVAMGGAWPSPGCISRSSALHGTRRPGQRINLQGRPAPAPTPSMARARQASTSSKAQILQERRAEDQAGFVSKAATRCRPATSSMAAPASKLPARLRSCESAVLRIMSDDRSHRTASHESARTRARVRAIACMRAFTLE